MSPEKFKSVKILSNYSSNNKNTEINKTQFKNQKAINKLDKKFAILECNKSSWRRKKCKKNTNKIYYTAITKKIVLIEMEKYKH